ncbi:MAG: alpha/beta fold hydrolase [Solirubrobacterales bacterium]
MTRSGERFAKVGDLELCYEEFGSSENPPMLLVMGLATQMIGWHVDFCSELAERGFRVIRYDNRDIGRSSKIGDAGVPSRAQMLFGLGTSAYTLSDLAADGVGLLDALEIDSAHVVGASMGGMIAQTVAIEHPRRVHSLASIMSSVGERRTGLPRLRAFGPLMKAAPSDRDGFIGHTVKTFEVIGSPGFETDEDRLRETAGQSFDRCRYPQGIARQLNALTSSPGRRRALGGVRAPTVVIHGDKDPLVRFAAGKATARAVPGARLEVVRGMGHDLPRGAWPQIVGAIVENARAAEDGRLAMPGSVPERVEG